MKYRYVLILGFCFLTSCATRMKVKVESADRDEVLKETEIILSRSIPVILATHEINMKSKYGFGELERIVYKLIEKEYEAGSATEDAKADFNEYLSNIIREDAQLKLVDNIFESADSLYDQNKYLDAYIVILRAQGFIPNIEQELKNYLKKMGHKPELIYLKYNIKQGSLTPRTGIKRLRYHLLGDPMVSYITKNENRKIWRSNFNKTLVSTFMGNADVAVILRQNPSDASYKGGDYNNNFTIKGVRLDASAVAQATFKALSQSINLFAAIQLPGIDLSSSGTEYVYSDLDDGVNASLNSITSNEQELSKRGKYLEKIREQLFFRIINEDLNSKTGPDFDASITEIKALWMDLKVELDALNN